MWESGYPRRRNSWRKWEGKAQKPVHRITLFPRSVPFHFVWIPQIPQNWANVFPSWERSLRIHAESSLLLPCVLSWDALNFEMIYVYNGIKKTFCFCPNLSCIKVNCSLLLSSTAPSLVVRIALINPTAQVACHRLSSDRYSLHERLLISSMLLFLLSRHF